MEFIPTAPTLGRAIMTTFSIFRRKPEKFFDFVQSLTNAALAINSRGTIKIFYVTTVTKLNNFHENKDIQEF